jgi:periplasmic protein TonB
MEFYYPSRRQDLLVGSFVSTLLIGAAYWFSDGRHAIVFPGHQPPVVVDYNFKQVDPDPPVDNLEAEATKVNTSVDVAFPHLLDLPRPLTPISIPQQIEPPSPNLNVDMSHIPQRRAFPPGTDVLNPSQLDLQPSVLFQYRPHYPSGLIQEGITGEVIVDFIVDSEGHVRNVSAIRSTNRGFEASAIEAVGKWKFRAGRKDGHAVNTHIQVPIEFSINAN